MDETDLLRFIDGLYGYAMAITRNRTDAEDLVQETYLRAIPRMRSLRPESNLKSWLFTILRNIHLNQLRKQRVAPKVLEIDAGGSEVQIRSQSPTPRADQRGFYEVRLSRQGNLRMERFALDAPPRHRHSTTCQLTREVLERLADDIAASAL